MVFSQWPSPTFSWSSLLILLLKWATEERGKVSSLHYRASWLWEALLFQVCQVSPAPRKKWTPAITCLSQWIIIFPGSLEEKDPMFLLMPLPFDAQTPASDGQEGCSLPHFSAAQVSVSEIHRVFQRECFQRGHCQQASKVKKRCYIIPLIKKFEPKKTSGCAETIRYVEQILRYNRFCQPELCLIWIYRQKKSKCSICVVFFFPSWKLSGNSFREQHFRGKKLIFYLKCMKHKITAPQKVYLMHFLLLPPSSARKKCCFKFKELSQEQRLTPPALFKLTSLPTSNRYRVQKKNIKNPCT